MILVATPYYSNMLEIGKNYQDFVIEYLNRIHGWGIQNYNTYYEQLVFGENSVGFEIKNDRRFRETGNLYIETEERSSTNREYVPSGIMRNDNTWLYLIGDEKTIYVFSKEQLKREMNNHRIIEIKMGTSKGFILNIEYCEKKCLILKRFDIPEEVII